MSRPLARSDELEIQELGDELVIYDVRADTAHALQPLAARVWRLSDGTRDVHALHAALVADATFADVTVAEVWSALDGLADASLLADRVAPPGGEAVSRRSAVLRVTAAGALGALSVPGLITSILAPLPLDAQSRVDGEQASKMEGEQSAKEGQSKAQNSELRNKESSAKESSAKGEEQKSSEQSAKQAEQSTKQQQAEQRAKQQAEQSAKQQSEQTAKQQTEQSSKQAEQSTKQSGAEQRTKQQAEAAAKESAAKTRP